MTNQEAQKLARELVGDGQDPNMFFVTSGPYYYEVDEFGDTESILIDGYNHNDTNTKVFDTLEEAEEYYDTVDLDIYEGIGQVMIEDRKTGVIKEKTLEKMVRIEYSFREHDDTKRFGYKK